MATSTKQQRFKWVAFRATLAVHSAIRTDAFARGLTVGDYMTQAAKAFRKTLRPTAKKPM